MLRIKNALKKAAVYLKQFYADNMSAKCLMLAVSKLNSMEVQIITRLPVV